MEKEPDTSADQVLTQVSALVSVNLGARVVEVVVLNEGANVLGNEIV